MKLALGGQELERLRLVLEAFLSLPTSTDVNPDAFEEMFAWAIGGATPMHGRKRASKGSRRSKLLFDVTRDGVGWSLKTFSPKSLEAGTEFSVVLARASVEAKARRGPQGRAQARLRIEELEGTVVDAKINVATSTDEDVGRAVMRVRRDVFASSAERQSVVEPREAFLLRSKDNRNFVYFENPLVIESDDAIRWRWTNEERRGLQGAVEGTADVAGSTKYRWYQSGGQLFGNYRIPEKHQRFSVKWSRMSFDEFLGQSG